MPNVTTLAGCIQACRYLSVHEVQSHYSSTNEPLPVLFRPNLRLHEGDAADYILKLASQVQQGRAAPLDLVFIDAFDGNDDVPSSFCSSGTAWLSTRKSLYDDASSLFIVMHVGFAGLCFCCKRYS